MTLTAPHQLLFGYWGSAPFPWLLLLSSKHKDNAALVAHERCHQSQQRRDGTFTFWWRYAISKKHRLAYELEAYKVWLSVAPHDVHSVARTLATKYGLGLTIAEAYALLKDTNA